MGGILPPKPPGTGVLGAGGGGSGKYFPNLYLKKRLHNEFQLPSTKIGGISLKGDDFTPKPPRNGGLGVGRGEGVNIFLLYI